MESQPVNRNIQHKIGEKLDETREPLREKEQRKLGAYPTKNDSYLESNSKYWYSTNLIGISNAKIVDQ